MNYSQNHIDVLFLHNNTTSWRLTCFYGFPERGRRSNSWDYIRSLASNSQLPWCIFGDFNDLLFATDKMGSIPHPPSLLEGFRKAIDDCLLKEIDLTGGRYTWEKSRGSQNWVRERLDRAFATNSWWLKFPLCNLSVHHVTRSDHDPINLDLLSVAISRKVFRFRFENTWLEEPTFRTEVSDFWLSLPSTHVIPKLLSVTSFMARWGRNFSTNFVTNCLSRRRC